MAYIIMGIDECGQEFRCNSTEYRYESEALEDAALMSERFPEARSIWVERFQDMSFFIGGFNDY